MFGDITAIYQGATKLAEYVYDAWGNCTITYDPDGYGATTYAQLLEQYIEMTDGDGEGDDFYTPENFEFVNGSISNYWDK